MIYYQRNLLILSATLFLATFSWEQVAPFLPLFLKDLGVTSDLPFWSGLLFTLQFSAAALMGPFWGKMADKYGRKLMTMRAGLFLSLVYFGMSLCQNYSQLVALRVLNGILTGFIPGSIALIASNTPQNESGRYVSVAYTFRSAGIVVGPALGGLLAAVTGYRGSLLVSGTLVFIAFLMVTFFVEEREKPKISVKTSIWQDCQSVFKMPVMVTIMSVEFINAIVTSAFNPILALHLQKIAPHAAKILSGFTYSLPGLALFLTAYIWGRIGEKISYARTIIIGLTGMSLSAILLGAVANIWLFGALYFIFGIFAAAITPSSAALAATKIDSDFRGRAFAMQQTARTTGQLIAPLTSGLIGNYFGLNWIFVCFGSLCFWITLLGIRKQIQSWPQTPSS